MHSIQNQLNVLQVWELKCETRKINTVVSQRTVLRAKVT